MCIITGNDVLETRARPCRDTEGEDRSDTIALAKRSRAYQKKRARNAFVYGRCPEVHIPPYSRDAVPNWVRLRHGSSKTWLAPQS